MKKTIVIIFFLLILPLTLAFPSLAQNNTHYQETVVLPRSQTVNSDYFTAGETVTLSGTVNGDAYIAGGKVLIDGVINGDLLVAGGSITIRGKVTQNVRVVGGSVTIASQIGRNLTVAGGSVILTDSAKIGGSLVVSGGNVEVFSSVAKNAMIGAGSATIGSEIKGDVSGGMGQLNLSSDAKIGGDLNYYSDNPAFIAEDATVLGKIDQNASPKPTEEQKQASRMFFAMIDATLKLFSLITTFFLGLLVLRFFPIYAEKSQELLRNKAGLSFIIGLITSIVLPSLALFFLITIFGIPIAFLLLIFLVILFVMAKIVVAYALGRLLSKYAKFDLHYLLIFIIGLLAYTLLSWIPVIGPIFSAITILMGLGAVLLQKKNLYTMLRSKKLI